MKVLNRTSENDESAFPIFCCKFLLTSSLFKSIFSSENFCKSTSLITFAEFITRVSYFDGCKLIIIIHIYILIILIIA